jgi:hypothetical protein
MMIFLLLLAGLACLVATASFIWLAIVAFQKHILWGLAVLFLPFAPIVFAIMNWHESRKPFLINVGSTVLTIVLVFGAGGAAFMMGAPMASEAMAVAGAELEAGPNPADVLAEATPPAAPESAPVALGHESGTRGQSSSGDRALPSITLEPSAVRLDPTQAGMATQMRTTRRSPGDEIPLDEIDETLVGAVLRVVSKDGLDSNARLTAVAPSVLSFERDVGIGTVTFDLNHREIDAVYLSRR